MKRSSYISALFLALLSAAGCEEKTQEIQPVKLETPEIKLGEITETSVTFSWEKVENASGYEYTVAAGNRKVASETVASDKVSATVEGLSEETSYKIALRATGKDNYTDSSWSEESFSTLKKEVEPGPDPEPEPEPNPDPDPEPDPEPEPEPDPDPDPNPDPEPKPEPKVYIAGSYNGNTAVLWVDGVQQDLTDGGIAAVANDVCVSEGGDVYAVGWDTPNTGNARAVMWENGNMTYLSDGKKNVQAKSVAVYGNDVYVAGNEVGVNNKIILWKNGVPAELPSSADYAEVGSMTVAENGDVYVVGYDNGPAVWKNGAKTGENLGNEATQLMGIFIKDNDLYYSGFRVDSESMYRAMIWKGTQSTELTDGTEDCLAYAVWVSDAGDVYVAGNQSSEPRKALLWKNGSLETLTSDSYKAFDVAGYGNDLYVAGQISTGSFPFGTQKAAVWKNGEAQILCNDKSEARSVYIHQPL